MMPQNSDFGPRTDYLHQGDIDWNFISQMAAKFPDRGIESRAITYFQVTNTEGRLKRAFAAAHGIQRSGYVRRNFPEDVQETLAEHLDFVAKLSWLFSRDEGQRAILLRAALIHDLPEVIASDFTPHDPITKEQKFALENAAARILFDDDDYLIWYQHERGQDLSSQMMRDCDRLEMPLHCLMAEFRYPRLKDQVQEFWDYTRKTMETPRGGVILGQMDDIRNEMQQTDWLRNLSIVMGFRMSTPTQQKQAYVDRINNGILKTLDPV